MTMRSVAKHIISLLPGKVALTKSGASLLPSFRNALTIRFLNAVAEGCAGLPADLDTNLGIDHKLRVRVSSSKSMLLFGAPKLFVGERASLDLAVALLKHSSCFLDIGSNIGLYIFYLRCRDKSLKPIYYFEPDPALFSRLETNIARNRIKHVRGFQVAMAEKSGKDIFFQNRTDDNSGTLVQGDWSQDALKPIEIDKTSFAEFVSKYHLENVCVKVDVEGAEELFFDGAKASFDQLNYLIIEILGPAVSRGFPSKVIREGNLQAYYINDYKLEYSPFGNFSYVAPFYNWLFCRESPTALRNKLIGTKFRVVD